MYIFTNNEASSEQFNDSTGDNCLLHLRLKLRVLGFKSSNPSPLQLQMVFEKDFMYYIFHIEN